MTNKNTFQTEVVYQNRRFFAQSRSGQLWAITDEDIQRFSITVGQIVVIEDPEMMDQFCRVAYVMPQSLVEA